jgi:hypothetical protein
MFLVIPVTSTDKKGNRHTASSADVSVYSFPNVKTAGT